MNRPDSGRSESSIYHNLYSRNLDILENLYENSPILFCTVSDEGIILDYNESFARHLGFSGELKGVSIFDQLDNNGSLDSMHEIIRVWKSIGIVRNREVWLKRKDGITFPVLLNASSLHDKYGNLIACNIAMVDESDIYETRRDVERTNEELRFKEKLKNEFIAIASHELRTPIQPILGFAVLAKKGRISQEEAWGGVLKEARRLQQLANDILDVSRIESSSLVYKMEKVRIDSLFYSVVESASANLSKDVSLDLVLDEKHKDIEIELDRSRITQVLTNIVGNAIKFTEKGHVKIGTIVKPDKNKMEIRVSDSGRGIPESILPNLFGKFVTKSIGDTNRHGTGLGLFISKAIVTAHKGDISAYNSETGGATFTIVLPIDQDKLMMLD